CACLFPGTGFWLGPCPARLGTGLAAGFGGRGVGWARVTGWTGGAWRLGADVAAELGIEDSRRTGLGRVAAGVALRFGVVEALGFCPGRRWAGGAFLGWTAVARG